MPSLRRRSLLAVAALTGALVVTAAPAHASTQRVDHAASIARTQQSGGASSVIVMLRDGVDPDTVAFNQIGRSPDQTFEHALNGYVTDLTPAAISTLLLNPTVLQIVPNQVFSISGSQPSAPWGLDRVDQTNLPLSGTYDYGTTGAGVDAYVIDTGIRSTHKDFTGRIRSGFDAVDGGAPDDCHGHGTHVAGTVGGTTSGVAKSATLIGVRVLDCQGSGTTAQIVSGIDWIIADHQPGAPAVANLSLGGGADQAIDTAIGKLVADGVTTVVAAGNETSDACTKSPARVPAAITVGASDRNDAAASFSNWGSCVDLFAPGVDILSAGNSGDASTATMSGTSMASPHTAGVAARYLQANPTATPAAVEAALVTGATQDKVTGTDGGGSKSLLCLLLAIGCPAGPTANNHLLHLDP